MAGGKLEKAILGSGSGCANIGSLAHGSRTSQFLAMDDDGGSSQTPPRSSREEGLGRGGTSPRERRGRRSTPSPKQRVLASSLEVTAGIIVSPQDLQRGAEG